LGHYGKNTGGDMREFGHFFVFIVDVPVYKCIKIFVGKVILAGGMVWRLPENRCIVPSLLRIFE